MASGIRVLCIDDEVRLAELVAQYLTDHVEDMSATAVASGDDALSSMEQEEFDCLVCDYQMPDMDGLEVLAAVRESDPDLPFILFTGQGDEQIAAKAVREGVSDYIPKSTVSDQYELLANRIRNVVERHRARTTTRELFNAASDAILVHEPESGKIVDVNTAGMHLWEMKREDLCGLSPIELCADEQSNRSTWLPPSQESESAPRDYKCQRPNGETFWAEIRVKPATIDGESRLLAVARDVTRRKSREQRLSDLLATTEQLIAAREFETIGEAVTNAMCDTLDFDAAELVVRVEGDQLQRIGQRGELTTAEDRVTIDAGVRELLAGDHRGDGGTVEHAPVDLNHTGLLYWPLGENGVLVSADKDHSFTPFTEDLIELLAAITTASLTRTFQERQLERHHEELTALNRMNELIRDINQTLVKVSTRDEIEHLVCKQLAAASSITCAWFGDHDIADQAVEVRVAIGRGADRLRDQRISTTDPDYALGEAISSVIESRTVQSIDDLTASMVGETHAAIAESTGSQSMTIVPITYQNALFDLLTIYSTERDPLGPDQRAVLQELGETIGYAMHTAERSRALLSDTSVELEYAIDDDQDIIFGLSAALGASVELERIFFRPDDSARLFVRVESNSVAQVRQGVQELVGHEASIRELTSTDESCTVEISVPEVNMMRHLAEAMATIRSATANDGTGRIVIEVPTAISVRTLTENLQQTFDSVSLLARRQRKRDDEPLEHLEQPTELGLTDRQHEVLLTAFHAGFFDWPRESTGEEIAELLEISQPTFHEHLRTGERKLLEVLFKNRRAVYS